jgi:hypothetical protein
VANEKERQSNHDSVGLTRERQNDDDAFFLYEKGAVQRKD